MLNKSLTWMYYLLSSFHSNFNIKHRNRIIDFNWHFFFGISRIDNL